MPAADGRSEADAKLALLDGLILGYAAGFAHSRKGLAGGKGHGRAVMGQENRANLLSQRLPIEDTRAPDLHTTALPCGCQALGEGCGGDDGLGLNRDSLLGIVLHPKEGHTR